MGKALYRSYRSKKLSEIVGQEHITDALGRALEKGTLSHAYLFTGPRGVGKTSIARILAHELNGLPYGDEQHHLDIIEIDAASNRRIDEIRDLRDKVHIAPTSAKYKVYIIDEVHMLTKEAFNALLKTLEEPPAHVVFVLATTEAHKLPETIVSRTQRFAFKPVPSAKVVAHLKSIAEKEKIAIDDDALELIAAHGEGSFRDSISLLDQMRSSGKKIALADVQASLGIAPAALIESITKALAAHDTLAIAQQLGQLQEQGYEPSQVARQLGQALRARLADGQTGLERETAVQLLTKLVEVPASSDPTTYLEIALLDAALAGAAPSGPPAKSKVMSEGVQAKPAVQVEPHPSSLRKSKPKPEEAKKPAGTSDEPVVANSITLTDELWQQVLASLKKTHNTLYSVLKLTQQTFEPGKVTLACSTAFYQKRLNDTKNQQTLTEAIKKASGHAVQIQCVVGEAPAPQPKTPAPKEPPKQPEPPKNKDVDTISNIFGGAEVLES